MSGSTSTVVKKVYADGRVEDELELAMTLEEMQAFVGGYIEMVPAAERNRALIVNEEGALRGLPFNETATPLAKEGVRMLGGKLRGNVLVVKAFNR